MKKTIFSLAVFFLALTALVGCQQELQNVRVKVKHEVTSKDTLIGFVAMAGEDSMLFSIADARFQNGLMLPGDSVIVDYIEGRGDTLRALVVTVLPKIEVVKQPEPTDSLITAPAKK